MMLSSVTGSNAGTIIEAPVNIPEVIEIKETFPVKKIEIRKSMTVEEYIRNYFSDIPVMVEVARCESRFRQHGKDGNVLVGEQNSSDKGVMQINEYYHGDDSDKLGYDIMTIEGNTAYARHLFEKYGLKPWKSSYPCWGRSTAYSEYKNLAIK